MTTRRVDKLDRALEDIGHILSVVDAGTADNPKRVARVDWAAANIEAWADIYTPGTDSGRGGTSSVTEVEDRGETRRLQRQIAIDHPLLPKLVDEIAFLTNRLYLLVARNTETLHPGKLPASDGPPGCVSCARPQDPRLPKSGHFAEVAAPDAHASKRWGKKIAESVARLALCSFCRTHAVDAAVREDADEVGTRHFPPLDIVDVLNRQSEQAAGREMMKRLRGAA